MLYLYRKPLQITCPYLFKSCVIIIVQHLCSTQGANVGKSGPSLSSIKQLIECQFSLFYALFLFIFLFLCFTTSNDLYQAMKAHRALIQPDNLMSLALPLVVYILHEI